MTARPPVQPPPAAPYTVEPHLDRFRIIGVSGEAGIVTYPERAEAEKLCRMLCHAYAHGAREKTAEVRTLLAGVIGQ
jgi:hypothetical protein